GGAWAATSRVRTATPRVRTPGRDSAASPEDAFVSESGGSDVSAFSAGAVARRLGVAVTTLRTWHQRYGLGPSLHEPGQHRRYTEQDIERLERMQRLIAAGVAPGEAARWATRGPEQRPTATVEVTPDDVQPSIRG